MVLIFETYPVFFNAMYILTPDENQQKIFTVKGESEIVGEMDKEGNRGETDVGSQR